ncbi:MAG: hypothetical protein IPI67_24615 [Myxococcales bacterium]|nr:hypothetical protein [Myxococcales bacterium]
MEGAERGTPVDPPRSDGAESESLPSLAAELPAAPEPELVGDDLVFHFGDRRWRIRGFSKNTGPEQLRVNLHVSRPGGAFHVDTVELYSARQRAVFTKQASDELVVEERVVKRELGAVLLKLEERQEAEKKAAEGEKRRQGFDHTIFFDEGVDIHHIFPEDWCKKQGISPKIYDTVVNKTPLSYRTNRIIGGVAPSKYLNRLEQGSAKSGGQAPDPPIERDTLNGYLRSHCIPVDALRGDDFRTFMTARQAALLALVSKVTGHTLSVGIPAVEEGEELSTALAHDAGMDSETE